MPKRPRPVTNIVSVAATDAGAATGAGDAGRKPRRSRIYVAVRKRPLEADAAEDCVEIAAPAVNITATKLRIDLTEYTESHADAFDRAFADPEDQAQALRSLQARLQVLRRQLDPAALLHKKGV